MATVQKVTRKDDFCDLDLDFTRHPVTGDVSKKKGVDAIARSVRNLIMTNFYDRPFRSWIGSNAQKLLFENVNSLTANMLSDAIKEVIENFEPRVVLLDVLVQSQPDENGYSAQITFRPVNLSTPYTITLLLEKIR